MPAIAATLVAAVFPGIPVGAFFVSHPLPAETWPKVLVPNGILILGTWLVVFLITRAVLRHR
jgi:hypothetical protein